MLYQAALAAAPAGLPEICQLLRPITKGRIARSQALLSGLKYGLFR